MQSCRPGSSRGPDSRRSNESGFACPLCSLWRLYSARPHLVEAVDWGPCYPGTVLADTSLPRMGCICTYSTPMHPPEITTTPLAHTTKTGQPYLMQRGIGGSRKSNCGREQTECPKPFAWGCSYPLFSDLTAQRRTGALGIQAEMKNCGVLQKNVGLAKALAWCGMGARLE